MDINDYKKNQFFERNAAIYILHTIDKLAYEDIAIRFQLAIEEVKGIIETHSKYEELMMQIPEK